MLQRPGRVQLAFVEHACVPIKVSGPPSPCLERVGEAMPLAELAREERIEGTWVRRIPRHFRIEAHLGLD